MYAKFGSLTSFMKTTVETVFESSFKLFPIRLYRCSCRKSSNLPAPCSIPVSSIVDDSSPKSWLLDPRAAGKSVSCSLFWSEKERPFTTPRFSSPSVTAILVTLGQRRSEPSSQSVPFCLDCRRLLQRILLGLDLASCPRRS